MEQDKIIKLLEFLTTDAIIEADKHSIVIKNFQYDTNIEIQGLPDWNYKVEFALRTDRNPFKNIGQNKGESFVLPYNIMKLFLNNLNEELNRQNNKQIIEENGLLFFNRKIEEVLQILNTENKVDEEFSNYTLCHKTELFNNVMTIEKPDDEVAILNHEFLKIRYTYIVAQEKEKEDGADPSYYTQTLKISVPAIEIENYHILSKCFTKPVKNDYSSLIDILRKNNQGDKMSKLLTYTKLDMTLESKKEKVKTKKI